MNKFFKCFFVSGTMFLPSVFGTISNTRPGFDLIQQASRKNAFDFQPIHPGVDFGLTDFVMESNGLVNYGNSATLSILAPLNSTINNYVDDSGIISNFRYVGQRALIDIVFNTSPFSGPQYSCITFNCTLSVTFGTRVISVNKTLSYYVYYTNEVNSSKRLVSVSSVSMNEAEQQGIQKILDDFYTPVQTKKPTIKWSDRFGNVFPLVGAQIKLTYGENSYRFLHTDENGQFDLTENPLVEYVHTDPITQCELILSHENIRLFHNHSNTTDESDYIVSLFDYQSEYLSEDGLIITKNKFTTSFWEAVQVFEGFYHFTQFAKEQMPEEDIGCCSVYYSNFGGCAYSSLNNYIEIKNKKESDSDVQPYENWDVFGHEYGHYLGYNLKINGADSNYSNHIVQEDDISYLARVNGGSSIYHANESGLALAWRESWPTYWSEVAQSSFPEDIKENYANQYVADGIYESSDFKPENYYAIDYSNDDGLADCEIKYGTNYKIGGDAYEIGLTRTFYKINREIGNYSENETPNHDYLLDIMKEVRNSTPHLNDDEDAFKMNNFGTFFNVLENKVQQGLYEGLTIEELSGILQSYQISPFDISFDINENKIFFNTSDEIHDTYLIKESSTEYIDYIDDYISFSIGGWYGEDGDYSTFSVPITPERTETGWVINNAIPLICAIESQVPSNATNINFRLSLQREQFEDVTFDSIIPLNDWYSLITSVWSIN
ncbi:MAG: hypothetical protein K5762_08045 [Bacilli bacterium]|nr:hypothetical protein [Bacilli bacterium]